jgi:AcrR family transcriptional regulator
VDGSEAASAGKEPRTARGRQTLRAILDAAAEEFGEKGFHEGSISGITRRAGVALGSFYTYFDSKDAVFRALVRDMSEQVREHVAPALKDAPGQIAAEQAALLAFIRFARTTRRSTGSSTKPSSSIPRASACTMPPPPSASPGASAQRPSAARCATM